MCDHPRRCPDRRAFRAYETLAGLMFLNQGLGVGCMAALQSGDKINGTHRAHHQMLAKRGGPMVGRQRREPADIKGF